MNKELEELEKRIKEIKPILAKGYISSSRENKLILELHNCELRIENYQIKQELELTRERLIYFKKISPQAEELVKELNKWYNGAWEYKENMQRKGFIINTGCFTTEKYIAFDNKSKCIYLSNKLQVPPKLLANCSTFFMNRSDG